MSRGLRLAAAHADAQLRESLRTPTGVVMGLAMPALGLLFFIVPQERFASDPDIALAGVVAFCVFGVMANALFGFAFEIASARERGWGAFLRSLPGPAGARLAGQVGSTGLLAVLSTIPVLVLGALTTEAEIEPLRAAAIVGTVALASVSFMGISAAIGAVTSARGSIGAVQLLMLVLAFAGGLFIPPVAFPDWLDAISRWLPSRAALELGLGAAGLEEVPAWALGSAAAWAVVAVGAAVALTAVERRRGPR